MDQIESDAFHHQVCEHLGVALVVADRDLLIQVWNGAASRTFGAAADQMVGTPIVQIVPQDRRTLADRMIRRTLETGEVLQFAFRHGDAHAMTRELVATIAPVVAPGGARCAVSMCVRDITNRIDLQNELNESRKMASLGEMAGAIAHHFNNILGGVVTSIDFAIGSDDTRLKTRTLEQIGPALQRATALIDGLLAFAQGDRRTQDLSDFSEIVTQVADATERRIAGTGTTIAFHLPKIPVTPVTRVATTTIITNIIENALEAMPHGGQLGIDVSLEGADLVVCISDTGCGLDEQTQSRIFEPFWTTKSTLGSPTATATGLGLAIAHGLAQMLGGSISVTSAPGKGSSFRVVFPKT